MVFPAPLAAPVHRPTWRRRLDGRSCWCWTSAVSRNPPRRWSRGVRPMTQGSARRRRAQPGRQCPSCSPCQRSDRGAGVPVVGALPRSDGIALPERHLGLVQAGETTDLDERLERMADFVAEHTQIDAIRSLAARGRPPRLVGCRSRCLAAGTAYCRRPGCGVLVPVSASAARLAGGGRGDPLFLAACR